MAKARQNLKRRIYSETVFSVRTNADAERRNKLIERKNSKKAGVPVESFDSLPGDFPNNQEDVVVTMDDNGNVVPEHEHSDNCTHHH